MAKSIGVITKKKRGRPVTTGKGTLIGVRLLDEPLASLDSWIAKQKDPELSRPEAMRRLVELGLTVKSNVRHRAGEQQKDRAREMAGKAIDRMSDTTAPADAQAGRKRRLLKGPEEFRDSRVDLKTKK
jgi:hypothetical protein